MIVCKDLIKIYQDKDRKIQVAALRGCDFTARKGEITSIIGPSGSGKTTLINILAGLETISSGEILVDGIELHKLTDKQLTNYRLNIVGLVDQFPEKTLFLESKVIDNLEFMSNLSLGLSKKIRKYNQEILEKLGIKHLENRYNKTLSGGEMTRVAVACSLAKKPKLLLCDEPTGQLDSENTEKVKDLLKIIAKDFGTTILVVTHDVRFLEGIDIACEIRDGRVSAILSKEDREALTNFPIVMKSSLDSTKSTRIPDIIVESLKLDKEIKYEISKEYEICLRNPQDLPPERISIEEKPEIKTSLKLKSLTKSYFKGKSIAIELEEISKYYTIGKSQFKALSDINLKICDSEILFIVGPSGSGKTTLLKLISGIEPVSNGNLMIYNNIISEFTDEERTEYRRDNMGLIVQQGSLYPYLTVEDNIYLKEIFQRKKNIENSSDAKELFKMFNIDHRTNSYPLEISGGELQRASIAISLHQAPKLLLYDEPTANLDSSLAIDAMTQIYNLHKDNNLTTLIATHNLSLIRENSRVIELNNGQIYRDGLVV
ncbi:MAG: ABC transporter ATP-binding protein [Asgard group archaeon]|nr:ABC transporter ATP-binding protein [Asgard group archaeon]